MVGWVPLVEGDGVKRHLERFAGNRKLRGVRHVIQDEADPRYILRADFNQGVRALRDFKLRYDILIFERHLPAAIEFVDRHPESDVHPGPHRQAANQGTASSNRGTPTCGNSPSGKMSTANSPAW